MLMLYWFTPKIEWYNVILDLSATKAKYLHASCIKTQIMGTIDRCLCKAPFSYLWKWNDLNAMERYFHQAISPFIRYTNALFLSVFLR